MSSNRSPDDVLYDELNGWLDTLKGEVHELRINQNIFWRIQEIVQANRRINMPSHFYGWMGEMYASATSVAIRRQVDPNAESISFLRLLQEIKNHPTVLSRVRYKSRFADSVLPESYQDADFDRQVGAGRDCVDPRAVEAEIRNLKDKTSGLKKYVNKRVAHYDKKEFTEFPTFKDVDDAIDCLEGLLKRYLLLFRAMSLDSALPVWLYNWTEIFRHPWIEESSLGASPSRRSSS